MENKAGKSIYEWIRVLVPTVVAAVLLFTLGVRVVSVSGESMRETLQDGDRLLVINSLWCGAYQPGDIVIVGGVLEEEQMIVKRVIAAEGQTVDIDFDAGLVYVDGAVLEEPYIREATHLQEGTVFPLTVPEGCVFIMGDNRNDSQDSRDARVGCVDIRSIIGRAAVLAVPGKTAELDRREWSRIGILNGARSSKHAGKRTGKGTACPGAAGGKGSL